MVVQEDRVIKLEKLVEQIQEKIYQEEKKEQERKSIDYTLYSVGMVNGMLYAMYRIKHLIKEIEKEEQN